MEKVPLLADYFEEEQVIGIAIFCLIKIFSLFLPLYHTGCMIKVTFSTV